MIMKHSCSNAYVRLLQLFIHRQHTLPEADHRLIMSSYDVRNCETFTAPTNSTSLLIHHFVCHSQLLFIDNFINVSLISRCNQVLGKERCQAEYSFELLRERHLRSGQIICCNRLAFRMSTVELYSKLAYVYVGRLAHDYYSSSKHKFYSRSPVAK
jgi:hypothetical protein